VDRDVWYVHFLPVLLRPVHTALLEGAFGVVMLLFIIQIMLWIASCQAKNSDFTPTLKSRPTLLTSASFTLEKESLTLKGPFSQHGHAECGRMSCPL
jgi:hypothetical protein